MARRTIVAAVLTIAGIVLAGVAVWMQRPRLEPIELSQQTTYIMQPTRADGWVDYAGAVNWMRRASLDVALFHARWADEAGNVWIGRRRELATIAHAAKRCFVTHEEKRPGDMLEDEVLAPGLISGTFVTATAHAVKGAWPLGVPGVYDIDDAHLARYAKLAKTREGFGRYLDEFVLRPVAA